MEKVLEMNNIMKIYPNGVVAVEDVTFELNKGEIHAFVPDPEHHTTAHEKMHVNREARGETE